MALTETALDCKLWASTSPKAQVESAKPKAMKRKERHQLKENELAEMIAGARGAFEANRSRISLILLIVAVAVAVVGGITAWRRTTETRAEQLLAEAMVAFNARVVPVTASPTEPGSCSSTASGGTRLRKRSWPASAARRR